MLSWSRCTISLQLFYGAMLHKVVWQSQAGYLWLIAVVAHPFQYGRAHSAHSYAVFYGDDALELLAHLCEDVFIQRLQESHIVVGNAHASSPFSTSSIAWLASFPIGPMVSTATSSPSFSFLPVPVLISSIWLRQSTSTPLPLRITDHVATLVWQLG